ncbi:alcohol dehydrogenase [Cladophialophora yegresii CBS 114405]|uniref:Alcohol dehydrogenase n=1 Tax=Cladophialophora yegresii CBS 114405 TaxID=1182544 RepID=W9W333_9EURO|nr:alcohol dehydrogenase [Cladophialophora yegresii CBS 114405]EXJ62338.1 alcohol dehydrogenase [Cladophialophora yegresii CBS 114405]
MSTPTRTLGRNGPQVTAIGFGAMSIGGAYGQKDTEAEKLAVLDRAHAIGERFWDTADVYFDSEDIIGKWFEQNPEKRKDIFLATKFGLQFTEDFQQSESSDPEYIREACERSLKRLGVETIDLYYCHRVNRETPIETTIQALVELKKQGKIRYIGLSEVSPTTLCRACAVHQVSALQVEYNPFVLDIEKNDLLRTCRELGVAVVAYSPVGRGFLTGQIKALDDLPANDFRRLAPKYSPENFVKIMNLVHKFQAVAKNHGATPAQACIAWLMTQGEDIIPIPGTRTTKYLEENTAAASLKLTGQEVQELRAAVDASEIPGDRYPAM